MGVFNALDVMIQQVSTTQQDYENNKSMIIKHFNGDVEFDELPDDVKNVIIQWEEEHYEIY